MEALLNEAAQLKRSVEHKKNLIIRQQIERSLPEDYLKLERDLLNKLGEIDELNHSLPEEQKVDLVKRFGIWGSKYNMCKGPVEEAVPSLKK